MEYQQASFQNCWCSLAKYSCVEKIFSTTGEDTNRVEKRRFASSIRQFWLFFDKRIEIFCRIDEKKDYIFPIVHKEFSFSRCLQSKVSCFWTKCVFDAHFDTKSKSRRQASLRKDLFRVAGEANRRVISLYRGFFLPYPSLLRSSSFEWKLWKPIATR